MRTALMLAVLASLAGCSTIAGDVLSTPSPAIQIVALNNDVWRVRYQLRTPVEQLIFPRSPDKSRVATWGIEEGFEIVSTDEGEAIRRFGGGKFNSVTAAMRPVYLELPSDYAPFSPFGDGGMLVYTGRLLACPDLCEEDQSWQIRLDAVGRSILIGGERKLGSASWRDQDVGRNVYVGPAEPLATEDFFAILDGKLPPNVLQQLLAQLPFYMHHFRERLGSLPERPMLFVSYDTQNQGGRYGRQGGVLPGQVFIHFYGDRWEEEMAKAYFAYDLGWHFAHEAAHFYQHMLYGNGTIESWVHEGGAEAMAALAMLATDPAGASYVEKRRRQAEQQCAKQLGERSLHRALQDGKGEAAYSCGLILNLALDAELRRIRPESDGLYAVWRRYIERAGSSQGGEQMFLAAIEEQAGEELAAQVASAVRGSTKDLRLD
jgi:hypothetical protein